MWFIMIYIKIWCDLLWSTSKSDVIYYDLHQNLMLFVVICIKNDVSLLWSASKSDVTCCDLHQNAIDLRHPAPVRRAAAERGGGHPAHFLRTRGNRVLRAGPLRGGGRPDLRGGGARTGLGDAVRAEHPGHRLRPRPVRPGRPGGARHYQSRLRRVSVQSARLAWRATGWHCQCYWCRGTSAGAACYCTQWGISLFYCIIKPVILFHNKACYFIP